jgi:hypothetical protein
MFKRPLDQRLHSPNLMIRHQSNLFIRYHFHDVRQSLIPSPVREVVNNAGAFDSQIS